jgi:hypothetical protein
MSALYPSYVDFDRFIDVAALQALDGFIAERIVAHIAARQDSFFLNQHRLDAAAPHAPGVREIWLSQTAPGTPYDYLDLDRPERWRPTAAADEFAPLMAFIATLPFAATARMLIIYDHEGHSVPAHCDHLDADRCHEFIWLRTRFNKRFYMLDPPTGERTYVTSHAAWFDTVNQFHGADATPELSFSIRVDGVFADALRRQIPFAAATPRSAAPALWASQVAAATPTA